MNSIRMLLASAAALGASATFAAAADLPPLYDTPLYERPAYQEVPEVQPVEIGSGWYLRGDVGYEFGSSVDAHYREDRPDYARFPYVGEAYTPYQYGDFGGGSKTYDIDGSADFSGGFGYQFTDYLRGDLTVGYWKSEIGGSRRLDSCYGFTASLGLDTADLSCSAYNSANVKSLELMANAYADLGTFMGLTPYVGGGLGAARIQYDNVKGGAECSYAGQACDPGYADFKGSYNGASDWRFAYSLMAGISYDLSRNLKLDVGYKFTDIDGGRMFEPSASAANAGAIGFSADDDGFQRHAIRAGIRYSLW